MGILDEDVQRVREAVNLREIVSQYVQLKRVGRRWVGLCPFHAEKSGSFNVNEENGLWKCFGCQKGGDTISFVREIEQLDFVGAVEWLASRCGIGLRFTEKGEDEGRRRRGVLLDAMTKAVAWYHERLLHGPDAGEARGYLRSRGLDGDVVRRYEIGWAPDAWDELARALRLPDDVLVDTGLGFLNRGGRPTDAFRGRVLFPIYDASGDPVAFGGRILPGRDGPKYKNSPETAIYSKSKVLYGLNWAKTDIVHEDEAIVCEGYTDVIGFAAAGVPRAVATCGTALTEEHLRLLKRFARRIVLAFDADAAGQNAAAKFYEWEKKLDLEVAVAAMPDGVDPADLARTDPAALQAAVKGAMPFLGFRVNRVLGGGALSSPEGRARAAETVLDVIREHPSELVRDQYVMEVADRCRLDPNTLRARLRAPGAARVREDVRRAVVTRDNHELEALRHLLHSPDEIDPLLMLEPRATEALFVDDRNLAAFRALASTANAQDAITAADPGAAELLLRLAVEETESEPEEVVARLVREATLRAVTELTRGARDAEVGLITREPLLLLGGLAEADSRRAAIESLLLWLGSRSEDADDR
ncbi:MAG: primase [Acidimicrobiaceae bacterium]